MRYMLVSRIYSYWKTVYPEGKWLKVIFSTSIEFILDVKIRVEKCDDDDTDERMTYSNIFPVTYERMFI